MVKAARRFSIQDGPGRRIRFEVGDEIPEEFHGRITGRSLVDEPLPHMGPDPEPEPEPEPLDDKAIAEAFEADPASSGSATDVQDWVLKGEGAERTARARVALAAETADGGKDRKSVVGPLSEILGIDDDAENAGGGD